MVILSQISLGLLYLTLSFEEDTPRHHLGERMTANYQGIFTITILALLLDYICNLVTSVKDLERFSSVPLTDSSFDFR